MLFGRHDTAGREMRKSRPALLLWASLLLATAISAREPNLRVIATPQHPFVESRNNQQLLNFDLLVENRGSTAYRLVAIKLAIFDSNDQLETARELNENGNPPAIALIGDRELSADRVADFYQPFFQFAANIELYRLRYELLFVRREHPPVPVALGADEVVTLDVFPSAYHPPLFCLPLRGLVLVHDGHDFYSHHRRYNLTDRYRSSASS